MNQWSYIICHFSFVIWKLPQIAQILTDLDIETNDVFCHQGFDLCVLPKSAAGFSEMTNEKWQMIYDQ